MPIQKKSTLNPNQAESYRPITISTTLSKLLKRMLIPNSEICDTQLVFREGRGTSFVTRLMSDTISYFKHNKSPLYVCSLDAEKSFDNIFQTYLFYKLMHVIPSSHWILLVLNGILTYQRLSNGMVILVCRLMLLKGPDKEVFYPHISSISF